MSDLADFLLARIAEDESPVAGEWFGDGDADPDFMWGPNRIKAECEAKRRIVDEHWVLVDAKGDDYCGACAELGGGRRLRWPCATLRALAIIYADHPDYRDEWR